MVRPRSSGGTGTDRARVCDRSRSPSSAAARHDSKTTPRRAARPCLWPGRPLGLVGDAEQHESGRLPSPPARSCERVAALVVSVGALSATGCKKPGGSGGSAAADGRRHQVAAQRTSRSWRRRTGRRVPSRKSSCGLSPGVPHRAALRGGLARQEGPTSPRDRRAELQGRPLDEQGQAGRGRGGTQESRVVSRPRGRLCPARCSTRPNSR